MNLHGTEFRYLDIPGLLATRVTRTAEDGSMLEDAEWRSAVSARLRALIRFLKDHQLFVDPDFAVEDHENVVIWFDDLNERGKMFARSGAPERWLDSFDRSPYKLLSNVFLLKKALDETPLGS